MTLKKLGIVILASLLLLQTGCAEETAPARVDILTQKPIASSKTPLTVLVKYAFSIHGFEAIVEEKFPEIDIVQVGNFTGDMGIAEYQSRLEHGDLADIVMTWPLEVGMEHWEKRLIDLSGMPFTSKYNLSMLNTISNDGKLYYLPGPAQVRGIVYNKTLFAENGWQVPVDFEGFITLCKEIENSGMRSIQLGFGNEEVLDTALIGYNYGNTFSSPEMMQWLSNPSLAPSCQSYLQPALEVFQRMIDEGIWQANDLNIRYAEREQMLFDRQCAMLEDSVLMARMGHSLSGSTDQFALMPFFSPGSNSDWARLYMVCYIGLNKELEKPENSAKYQLVLKLMDYISTQEGQDALALDTGAMLSSLTDVPPPAVAEINDILPAIAHGRYAIFPALNGLQQPIREGMAAMLKGEKTVADVIKRIDQAQSTTKEKPSPEIYGKATENFTILETGSFVTDAMRARSGCEIALFLDNGKDGRYNGKGITAALHQGEITNVDLERILPDFKQGETGTLWKVQLSGADLLKILEYSISVSNYPQDWFYYFSGLKMRYDPTVEPGTRVKSIAMADGSAFSQEKMYSVAILDHSIPDALVQNCEKTDLTIADLLAKEISEKGTISPLRDGRFVTQ